MSVTRVSSQTSPVVDRVTSLVAPIVTDLGLDLYDIEYTGGIVRIVVDTQPGGQAGVSLENIALITRLVSREFDHSDPIPGRYTLEVTSPGLERTLRLPRHFVREVGKTIAVRLSSALDGQRRIQGDLVSASEDTIVVRLTAHRSNHSSFHCRTSKDSFSMGSNAKAWFHRRGNKVEEINITSDSRSVRRR